MSMNFRVDFPLDNSRSRILKTGAAVDMPNGVFPSLTMAREALKLEARHRMEFIRTRVEDAARQRERDLDEDAAPVAPVAEAPPSEPAADQSRAVDDLTPPDFLDRSRRKTA